MTKNTLNGPNITNGSFDEIKTRFTHVSNVLVYSQISPNVQSPYGHGPQKYNTVAQSEAHSENSQSTRSLFT